MTIQNEAGPFAIVPLWVMDALIESKNPEAMRLYIVLNKWANASHSCWPSKRTIAEACGVSENTVDRYRSALIEVGALRVEARWSKDGDRSSNTYTLMMVPPEGTPIHGTTPAEEVEETPSAVGGSPVSGVGGSPVHGGETRSIPELDNQEDSLRSSSAATAAPPKCRDERDALYQSIVTACGMEYGEMTKRQQRSCAVAMAELAEVGATPDEVLRRASIYPQKYHTVLTPNALANQWAALREEGPPPKPIRSQPESAFDRAKARLAAERVQREQTPNVVPLRAVGT